MYSRYSHQGELFVQARKHLKCSQARLARMLHVNKSTISRIEKGLQTPSGELIARLEKLCGLTAAELAARGMKNVEAAAPQPAPTELADLDTQQLKYLWVHYTDEGAALNRKLARFRKEVQSILKLHELGTALVPGLQQAVANEQQFCNAVQQSIGEHPGLELVKQELNKLTRQLTNQELATTQPHKIYLAKRKLANMERELNEVMDALQHIEALLAQREIDEAVQLAQEVQETATQPEPLPQAPPPLCIDAAGQLAAAQPPEPRAPEPERVTAIAANHPQVAPSTRQPETLRVLQVRNVAPSKPTQRCTASLPARVVQVE